MSLSSFLFNGSPPASTTTYGTSSSSLPTWYGDFTQGLISKANSLASSEYSPYKQNRLSGFQPGQLKAAESINALSDQYRPGFDSSGNLTQGAYAPAAVLTQSAGNTTALGASPQAQNAFDQALGSNIANNYTQAGNMATSASQAPAWSQASPYLAQQQQYLNPIYQNIERLGAERLGAQESGIRDQFIRGGTFGGSRQSGAMGAARRASLADISGQQLGIAQQGWNQANQLGAADLARQLQGAQVLGSQTAQQQAALSGLGGALGQLSQSDLQRRLLAGSQSGQIGTSALNAGLETNKALDIVGRGQQQQLQQGLDLAYQDHQAQLQHPYAQTSFLNSVIRGLQIPTTQSVSQTGASNPQSFSPSGLAQITGAGLGLQALGRG